MNICAGIAGYRGAVPYSPPTPYTSQGISIYLRTVSAVLMSWKYDIMNQYALHLFEEHRFEDNFDTDLEYEIMKDWLTHEKFRDGARITVKCDHINCNWARQFDVMYTVTPVEEEE